MTNYGQHTGYKIPNYGQHTGEMKMEYIQGGGFAAEQRKESNPTAHPQITARSTLEEGLGTLENSLAELQGRIDVLTKRLTPVLRGVDTSGKDERPEGMRGDSQLLCQLRAYQGTVDTMVAQVNALLNNLEV